MKYPIRTSLFKEDSSCKNEKKWSNMEYTRVKFFSFFSSFSYSKSSKSTFISSNFSISTSSLSSFCISFSLTVSFFSLFFSLIFSFFKLPLLFSFSSFFPSSGWLLFISSFLLVMLSNLSKLSPLTEHNISQELYGNLCPFSYSSLSGIFIQ